MGGLSSLDSGNNGAEHLDLRSALGLVAGLIFCFRFHGELQGGGHSLGEVFSQVVGGRRRNPKPREG
jgi:hypothetical protein